MAGFEPATSPLAVEVSELYATPAVLNHSGTSGNGLFYPKEVTVTFTTIGKSFIAHYVAICNT